MKEKLLIKAVIVLLLLNFAATMAGVYAQSSKDRVKGIYVENDADIAGNATVAGTLDVTGATTLGSISAAATTLTGDLTLENGEAIGNNTDGLIDFTGGLLFSTTTITVTDGDTITPTLYNLYNLDSAGAVTMTLAACTEGQFLILAGDDTNDITIADSNIRTDNGAAAVVNQYDLFIATCVDSEWLQIANPTDS